jgi:hypothetical protein
MPRLITDRDRDVFVSVEQTRLALSDVRRALPQLRSELRRKWPIQEVELENRVPPRRNPYTPAAIAGVACVGIAVRFGLSAAQAAGKKVGDVMGQEIAEHVQGWIRRIGKGRRPVKNASRVRRPDSHR